MAKGSQSVRYVELEHEGPSTRVQVVLDLDGGARQDISTGFSMLDRLLQMASYDGYLNVGINVEADYRFDGLVASEVGAALGKSLRQALADGGTIVRTASVHGVCDEALVLVAMELQTRGHLSFELPACEGPVGDISAPCIKEFFSSLVFEGEMCLHVHQGAGSSAHHLAQATFKGFGQALHLASRVEDSR